MTWLEITATIFGILCVGLTIRQNIWCWPTGLVQVSIYVYIFWHTKLYSDFILHIIYVFLAIYGWWLWSTGRHHKNTLQVSPLGNKILLWILLSFAGTLAWGYLMSTYTNADVPYPDAYIAVTSLIAQWLMTRKKLESWLLWVVVNIIAIRVYWYKELYITSGLYTVFLVMAVLGFIEWKKSYQQNIQLVK